MHYRPRQLSRGEYELEVDQYGQNLIHNPLLNKGTAFSESERNEFKIEGLLPPRVADMDEQLKRTYENYSHKPDNIERYIYLRALQDRNETLFYALLRDRIHEMLPVVYTPTVGDAVEKYGHIFRNARGLFITPENVDRMDELVEHLPTRDIQIIVATDNQGILGIGDQGAGGMAIPIGKLSLYTVGSGIHPSACLPISLDVGTDNQSLIRDPLYLGMRHQRIRGKEYEQFIEKFVEGVRRNFPGAILQWEDFSKENAFQNMDRYADRLPSFNDDIQGTGAVTLAGIIGAMKIKKERLSDQNYAILGAGAAGIGIARQIQDAMKHEGLTEQQATERIFVLDSRGLMTRDRNGLEDYKRPFAQDPSRVQEWSAREDGRIYLEELVSGGRITVLIGVSAIQGAFHTGIIDAMLQNTPEPVIFPLSNPTSRAEADPRYVMEYTGGKAVVASGSPFDPVHVNGKEYVIGQGNNAFIFPGVGLGAIVSRAKKISPALFTAAAHAVANSVTAEDLARKAVYPPVDRLFEVSLEVALAVYSRILEEGNGHPLEGNPRTEIERQMWLPVYPRYIPG